MFTIWTKKNKRNYQEDRWNAIKGTNDAYPWLFAVYDGHGGDKTSTYLADTFGPTLRQMVSKYNNPQRYRKEIEYVVLRHFEKMDEYLKRKNIRDGSTVTGVLIWPKHSLYFNLGDSRTAVYDCDGQWIWQTVDHKPDSPTEQARISGVNDMIGKKICTISKSSRSDVSRVRKRGGQTGLALSRAMGDFDLKHNGKSFCVSSIPDLTWRDTEAGYIIVASDGIWDAEERYGTHMFQTQIYDTVQMCLKSQHVNDERICDKIGDVLEMMGEQESDNQTVIVIDMCSFVKISPKSQRAKIELESEMVHQEKQALADSGNKNWYDRLFGNTGDESIDMNNISNAGWNLF